MAEERSSQNYEAELRRQALELERIRVALESADKLEIERIHNSTTVLAEREKAAEIAQAANQKYYDSALAEQQHQIDRRLETQLRERTDTERHLEQQIRAVRELVEQQQKAVEVASVEREKAASQLRQQLAQQIDAGYQALHDHIDQQIGQLRIQLESAQRESEIRAGAQQTAIDKQEKAYEARFQSVNGVRAQLQDLITSHQRSLSELTTTLMPREVAEAKIAEGDKKIAALTSRLDQSGGQKEGSKEATTARQMSSGATIAIISTFLAVATLIVGIVLAANAITGA